MRVFVAFTLLLAGLSGWIAYRWGKGPDPALELLAARPRQSSQERRPPRESKREEGAEVIQRLKRDEFLIPRDYLRGLEAWNHVKNLSLAQVKEALAITGEKAGPYNWDNLATLLFHRWGELDPEDAMRHVSQLGEKETFSFGYTILVAWVKRDPEGAYRWSLGNPKLAENLRFNSMLPSTLMSESAASAMEKSRLFGNEAAFAVASTLAQTMAGDARSRAEFLAAIAGLDEKARQDAIGTMINTWGRRAPEEVLQEWDQLPIPPEKQRPTLDRLLKLWGQSDPTKAEEWLTTHPDKAYPGVEQWIYTKWLERDAGSAERWLRGRSDPGGFAADTVKQMHFDTLNNTMGINWGGLSKEKIESNRQTHYRIWAEAKPEEAARWLESIGPEAAKTFTGATDAR